MFVNLFNINSIIIYDKTVKDVYCISSDEQNFIHEKTGVILHYKEMFNLVFLAIEANMYIDYIS